jgi:hypothetical protein
MTNFANGDPEALDQLADNILSRGGDIVIADLLNEYRYGCTTKWDVVREILRMAAEEMTETRAIVG